MTLLSCVWSVCCSQPLQTRPSARDVLADLQGVHAAKRRLVCQMTIFLKTYLESWRKVSVRMFVLGPHPACSTPGMMPPPSTPTPASSSLPVIKLNPAPDASRVHLYVHQGTPPLLLLLKQRVGTNGSNIANHKARPIFLSIFTPTQKMLTAG